MIVLSDGSTGLAGIRGRHDSAQPTAMLSVIPSQVDCAGLSVGYARLPSPSPSRTPMRDTLRESLGPLQKPSGQAPGRPPRLSCGSARHSMRRTGRAGLIPVASLMTDRRPRCCRPTAFRSWGTGVHTAPSPQGHRDLPSVPRRFP